MENYFLLRLKSSVVDEPEACQPCISGATCLAKLPGFSHGGDLATIVLKPGWWRLSNRTTDLRSCDGGEEGGCLGDPRERRLHGRLLADKVEPSAVADVQLGGGTAGPRVARQVRQDGL